MEDRFILQKSEKPEYWVCTDKENSIVCVFENHNYNDNQEFTILEDIETPDALALAKAVREMADWLRDNHYDKIFES